MIISVVSSEPKDSPITALTEANGHINIHIPYRQSTLYVIGWTCEYVFRGYSTNDGVNLIEGNYTLLCYR